MKPLIILLGIIICCLDKLNAQKQVLEFKYFTIETPKGWTIINRKGIDSYVGGIKIDQRDSLAFDLGLYSNDLSEPCFQPRKNIDPDIYRKNNISWGVVDGRKAKFIYPVISGNGTTGIFIDSLWGNGGRFNLEGWNLKPENEKLVREALNSLKFHQ